MRKIVAMLAVLVPVVSMAGDGGGSDGCGLGWQVTKKKSFLATTTRGTTNAIVPPTFGMTTGTIGCDQHSFAKRDIPAMQFVATNYDVLKMQMAAGSGESLEALARTMGCKDASLSAFARMTQDKYEVISNAAGSIELFNAIKQELSNDAALASSCSA